MLDKHATLPGRTALSRGTFGGKSKYLPPVSRCLDSAVETVGPPALQNAVLLLLLPCRSTLAAVHLFLGPGKKREHQDKPGLRCFPG